MQSHGTSKSEWRSAASEGARLFRPGPPPPTLRAEPYFSDIGNIGTGVSPRLRQSLRPLGYFPKEHEEINTPRQEYKFLADSELGKELVDLPASRETRWEQIYVDGDSKFT